MPKRRLTPRGRQMRRVVQDWERSGLTQREFAGRRGIAASTLGWWRHVLRRSGAGQKRQPPRGGVPELVEVKLTAPTEPVATAVVPEVVLRSGCIVRVPSGFDPTALRTVVATLEGRC